MDLSQFDDKELLEQFAKGKNALVMQTLIFNKKSFKNKDDALKWASDHGMKTTKVDEKDDSFHVRQRDPGDFFKKSMRTIVFSNDIHAVVGRLRHLHKPEGGALPSHGSTDSAGPQSSSANISKPEVSTEDRLSGHMMKKEDKMLYNNINENLARNDSNVDYINDFQDVFADSEESSKSKKIRHKKGASVAQSIIFDKKKFPSKDSVSEWAKQNGYSADKIRDVSNVWVAEQYDTGKFDSATFRTIDFGKAGNGVKANIAVAKENIMYNEGIDPIEELNEKVEKSATLLEQLTEGFRSLASLFVGKRDDPDFEEDIYIPFGNSDTGHVPPDDVRAAANLGLELRRQFNRGGTMVGVARARDLSNGAALSDDTIKRMVSYFARHAVDKDADGWGSKSNPSAGWIAWLLWGGDPGRTWAQQVLRDLSESQSGLNQPSVDGSLSAPDAAAGAAGSLSSSGALQTMESDLRFDEKDYESLDASIISLGEDDPSAEGSTEGEPWIERNARLFRTGTHKGIEFTEQHIDNMVNTFVPPTSDHHWSVPLQLNHELDARQTIGHVRNVWKNGPTLMGRLRIVGEPEIKNVKGGKWTRLSVGIRKNYSLMEVSVVPLPHIHDACMFDESDASFSNGSKNDSAISDSDLIVNENIFGEKVVNVSNGSSQSKGNLKPEGLSAVRVAAANANSGKQTVTKNKEEIKMSNETNETAAPTEETSGAAAAAAYNEAVAATEAERTDAVAATSEVVAGSVNAATVKTEEKATAASFSQDGLEELKRQLYAEFEAKTRAMEERMAKQESIIRYQEALDTVMSFIETGVTIPAQKDKELEFVVKLMEVGDTELVERYKEIKSLAQPIVKYGRLSSADIRKPAASKTDQNPDDIEQEALTMLAEAGFSRNSEGKFSRK